MIEAIEVGSPPPATVASCKALLAEQGWAILPPHLLHDESGDRNGDDSGVRASLRAFGDIIPQFNGHDTFEVTLKPGFENVPYSQSLNGIGPHTEAPVYEPPPKYLALHCHRQAQCGGGHTLLADGFAFYESLDGNLKDWAEESWIDFAATVQPGGGLRRTHRARIMSEIDGGRPVFRFSYNLFRFGDVNPSQADMESVASRDAGTPLERIALSGEAFFHENVIPVLIPEDCVLIWDNHRLMHARGRYSDPGRHLTRYWLR